MFNVNSFLGNSVRGDLIGPELWTGSTQWNSKPGEPENEAAILISPQLPYYAWDTPAPGLSGKLYVVHNTKELSNVVSIEISESAADKKVGIQLFPVRNEWTPALLKTWYRSKPNTLGADTPTLGGTTFKETKCISPDNVFVSEAILKNNSNVSRCYELKIVVPLESMRPAPETEISGPLDFTTTSWGDKTYHVFAALSSTLPAVSHRFELPPYGELKFRYGFAIDSQSTALALGRIHSALENRMIFAQNVKTFNSWFAEKVPALKTNDQDIMKMYYYRWFVVYRSMHETRRMLPEHNYARPVMYESPTGDGYSGVVGLPVPMQIQEAAWLRDSAPGKNHILNWCDELTGYREYYIQFTAMSIWRFLQCHPDRQMAQDTFAKIRGYALNNVGNRFDRLPVQCGSWCTGAEYQPNFYQFTTPQWDFRHDCEFFRQGFEIANLTRLDTVGFAIGNLLGAAKIANFIEDRSEADTLSAGAETMLNIIREKHWDSNLQMFLAADPATGKLADQAACYDSFIPYMWGMIEDKTYLEAFKKFVDPEWFWDEFPISTAAKTCPMYFGGAALIGPYLASSEKPHNYNCSWNGPTWHYSNSLAAEAFGQAALIDPEWRSKWLEFFNCWSEMHFQYGDRTVPRACEHHRPEDGGRCASSTDYFHSSWIDPFIRYWCGVNIADNLKTVCFDPFHEEDFTLSSLPIAGQELTFVQQYDGKTGTRTLTVTNAQGKVVASGQPPLTLECNHLAE